MQFQPTHNPDCTACGLPILHGMEVSYNRGKYHAGCVGRLMKEKKDELNDTKRAESDEAGVVSNRRAAVN
jgi:hypothetical protein